MNRFNSVFRTRTKKMEIWFWFCLLLKRISASISSAFIYINRVYVSSTIAINEWKFLWKSQKFNPFFHARQHLIYDWWWQYSHLAKTHGKIYKVNGFECRQIVEEKLPQNGSNQKCVYLQTYTRIQTSIFDLGLLLKYLFTFHIHYDLANYRFVTAYNNNVHTMFVVPFLAWDRRKCSFFRIYWMENTFRI